MTEISASNGSVPRVFDSSGPGAPSPGPARRGARLRLLLVAALSVACAHTRFELHAGVRGQEPALGDVRCLLRVTGAWKGELCAPRPQLVLWAESDCLIEDGLWLAVNEPPESRIVVPNLPVTLEPGYPGEFVTPCITPPRSKGATVSVSIRARCARTGEKLASTTRCEMP